jgi:hypothetical protein
MSRTKNRIIATLTAALVAAALAPSASVAYQDLRSPDARDAAQASQTTPGQDLRSPDARDAASASQARSYQDLRSPDSRDAGQRQSSPPATATGDPTGTDWGDVGLVAGGVVMLIALGGLVLFGRRRGGRKSRVPVVAS